MSLTRRAQAMAAIIKELVALPASALASDFRVPATVLLTYGGDTVRAWRTRPSPDSRGGFAGCWRLFRLLHKTPSELSHR